MMRRSSITPPERGRSRTRLTASAGSVTSRRGPQRRTFGALQKKVSTQTKTPQDSTTQKKRTAGSPASVDSGSDPAWKRRRLSTDTTGSLDEKRSTRKSSLEKNGTPPSKGKTEQSKPHQDQTSSGVGLRSSARVKGKEAEDVDDDEKSHSSDSRKARVSDKVTPKTSKPQPQKAQSKDLKDSLANEMKRLSTTEGFWSSRSGSRSGSPSAGVDGNERGSASQRTSRTSTPEVSPSAVRRKSIINSNKKQPDTDTGRNTSEKSKSKDTGLSKKQKDKQLDSAQKSGGKDESASRLSHSLPTPELRRLQTTEGFWSPNFSPLPPRNSSRDVSPSSTSSLDRIGRHGARSLSRGSDNRNEEAVMEDDDQQSKKGTQRNSTRSLSRGSDNRNEDMAMDQDDQGQKKATQRKSVSSNLRRNQQDDTRSESENGPRGNLRRGDLGKITDSADERATKIVPKFKRSRGSSEGEKNRPISKKEGSTGGASSRSPKLAARHKLAAQRLHRHSLGANLRRTSPQKLMGFRGLKRKLSDLTPRKSLRKTDDTNTQTKIEPEEENVPDPASNKTSLPADSVTARPPVSSPEFAISDLLGSAELKRLNTTAGFWAPTPDIGRVLGVLPRRLRDGDIGAGRETSNQDVTESSAQGSVSAVKRQKSPVKPQSSLLQHRKKKLHSLKQTLKKNRLLSKGKSAESSVDIDDSGDGKPLKKRRFVYGARKRKGKKGVRIGTKVEPKNKDGKELEEKSADSSESVPTSASSAFSGMTLTNTTGALSRSRRKQQDATVEASGSSASVITAVTTTSAGDAKTIPTVPEVNSSVSPQPRRGRPPKTWKRGRHKLLLVNSPRSSSSCSSQGAIKTWRRGRRKLVPSVLSGPRPSRDAKSTSQGTPLKTWKRGRKKKTPDTVRPVVLPSSNIRTRAKDFEDLEKSLEVLRSLEPTRKEEQGSSMARISQYQLLYEAATSKGPVVEITDIKSDTTKYPEIFGASKPKEQPLSVRHVHIDHTYDKTNTQSGDKKDNLFESMGIDLNAPLPDSPVKQNDSNTSVIEAIDKSSEKEDNSDVTKHNAVNEDQTKEEKSVVSLKENDIREKSDQSIASVKSGEDEEDMETSDQSDISVCATKQVVEEATTTTNEQQSEEVSLPSRKDAAGKQVAENEKESLSHKNEDNAPGRVSTNPSSSQMSDCTDIKTLEDIANPREPQEAVNADIQAKDVLKNEKIEGEKIEIGTNNSQVTDEKSHEAEKDQQGENVTTSSKSTDSSNDIIISDSFVQDTAIEELSTVESAKTESTKDLCHIETAEASLATLEPSEPSAAATEQPETSVVEPQAVTTVSGKEDEIDSLVRDDVQQDLSASKVNKEETDQVSAEGEVCAISNFTGLSTTGQASSTTQQSVTSALEALRANVHKARLNARKKKKPKSRFFVRKNRRSLQKLGDSEQMPTTANVLLADPGETSALPDMTSIIDSAGDRGGTSPLKNPLRRVRKRRKNAWQRGVLRKAVNMSRKVVSKLPSSNYSLPTNGTVATATSFGTSLNTENTSAYSGNTETETTTVHQHYSLDHSKRTATGKKLAMLRRLQTNANLASADLDEKILKGRFLRTVPAKEKSISLRRKHLAADSNVRDSSDLLGASSIRGISALHIDIPVDSMHHIPPRTPRKRGRPRKHSDESLPQLTPTNLHPIIRQNAAWNKAPPRLSPQIITNPRGVFFPADESKANRDNDFVSESVDETDFHLYLSGVSDEDSSPVKDTAVESFETQDLPPAFNLDGTDVNSNIESAAKEPYPRASSVEKTKTVSAIFMPTPTSLAGKEVKKPGRKMKGRRGRPPGIPMTEEERKRKAEKMDSPLSMYDSLDIFKRPGTARKSMMYSSPASSSQSPVHVSKFSLRKKSTRSPLEMLEMKRKQEEAMYDMEQERRQARLIHLREKRSARESGDDPSDEGDGVSSEGSLKMCSVVLSDFVKKLQLDNLDSPSDSINDTFDSRDKRADSPDYDPAEDQDQEDEDWCADLEDFDEDDDEWGVRKRTGSRPYIPRLKLKRIMKKGKESQIKRSNPVPILPKPAQHEPIKLLIKTEPLGEFEDGIGKTSSVVDISKMERSGFEGSFLDFLKGKKSEVFMHSKIVSSQKKTYVSKPVQSLSPNMSESNKGTEILSLPTSGSKSTSPSSMISPRSSTPEKLTADGTEQSSVLALQNTTPVPAITAVPQESSEQIKDSSLVEDEEDDILILDLDDGTQDQNSDDSHKEMAVAEDDQGSLGPIAGETTMAKCQDTSITQPDTVNTTEELQNPILATNIERDLMMSSCKKVKDQNVLGKMDDSNIVINSADVSATSQPVTIENVVVPGTSDTQLATAVTATNISSQGVSTVVVTASSTVAVTAISTAGATQTVPSCTEVVSGITKTGNSETDAARPSKEQDTDKSLSTNIDVDVGNESKSDKSSETETPQKQTVDVPESEKQDVRTSETGSVIPRHETNENVDQTELVPAVAEKGSSVTTNTSMASKSPPNSSVITKRPGITAENSKSPKHSTHIGSDPEEWRIKVIPQSDKQPPARYTCKRCGFVAPAKLTIESHIYSHIPGVQFRCAYCESEFSSMTATSTHLKNTHPMSEAKLCISRHLDEKNFYREDRIHAEDTVQSPSAPPVSTPAGGQSPPVIISLVVSGPVGAGRGGRSSAPPHRFVCTHCGFSTNVRGDAEHHVSDLHPSQSLFACTLCNENIYYSEMEIKDHSASVHPSRSRPYRKLPDFYDAEQLSQKGKVVDPDDRENIFERMSSIFQDDGQGNTAAIDHRQKAKDYLILQERWREKTSAEADSTTAVDYTDDHDNSEDQSRPQSATPHSSPYEEVIATSAENEVSGPAEPLCLKATAKIVPSSEDSASSSAVPDETTITSSAGATAGTDIVGPEAPTETDTSMDTVFAEPVNKTASPNRPKDQVDTERTNEATDSAPTVPAHGDSASIESSILLSEGSQEEKDAEESAEESMGLKIVEVVSLSGQVEDEESAVLDMSVETNREKESDKKEGAQPELQGAKTDNATEEAEAPQTGAKMVSEATDSLSQDGTTSCLAQAGEAMPTAVVDGEHRKETASDQQQTQTTASAISNSAAEDTSNTSSALSSAAPGGASLTDFLLTYKCNACRVHTPYLLMMVKHLKAKHPNTRCFACPYCKTTQSFFSQKQIRQHVKQAHTDKIGRNEIALSEKAKTFVEALVLSHTPECIRVGNRLVLEEDIHTCTYCQFKMTSLASVYEHLNEKHSDLFEFVCPVCQSFKSKILDEIKHHCFQVHKSSLDTDKVHVSVPKNLFTAITCISKNAKYIEKSLDASGDGGSSSTSIKASSSSSSSSSSSTSSQQQSTKSLTVPSSPQLPTPQAPTPQTIGHLPSGKVSTPVSPATPRAPVLIPLTQALPQMSVISQTPLIAIPLMSGGVGAIPTIANSRPVIAFSSALFDTSSLTPPPQLAATHTSPAVPPLVQNAAAASFLAPRPQQSQSAKLQSPTQASSKQINSSSSKSLPVLNVPTVKPRVSPSVSKSLDLSRRPDHSISPKAVPPRAHSANISPLPTSLVCHTAPAGPANPPSATDNLPEDEPNPDAFKIFNLRPTGSIIPASTPARSPASVEVPTVFPPVSTPISSGYIQGPIAGFPTGMVIPPSLLPPSFPFGQQQQSLVPSLLSSSSPIIDSSTPRYLRHPQPSSSTPSSAFQPAGMDPLAAEKSNATKLLKQQQQRELHHLKQKQIQMFETLRQQQLLRERHHKEQLAQPMPKAHPAHQQPPSLSGQVYQPQPLSVSPLLSSQQPLARSEHPPNPLLHHSPPLSSSASTSSLSSASSLSSQSGSSMGPNTMRPAKGQHKRSSSLYQCPYCPTVVTLKALEVASHIQQLHPGSAVVFRKIIS